MTEKNDAVSGILLRIERLKQKKEQKEVCFGICVPSYLCKIEKGQAAPDKQTLAKLFLRLGIHYETDQALLNGNGELIAEYFNNVNYCLDTRECYQKLVQMDQSLSYSCYAIEWLMIRCFEYENGSGEVDETVYHDCMQILQQLVDFMSPVMRGYYDILYIYSQNQKAQDYEECLKKAQDAFTNLGNAFSLGCLCETYLLVGDYTSIHQLENRFISIAVEEGNTYQLANYYFLNGTAYACLMMEDMMISCYERSIHLLQNTRWSSLFANLYYNLGSTYLSLCKYDLAWKYLEKAYPHNLSTLRMKALTLIRQGKADRAKEYLDQMKEQLQKESQVSVSDHLKYKEACMECEEHFMEDPEYEKCLEELIDALEKECHFGHLYFYADVIIETYRRQRKYKKAMDFQQRISSKHK